jgi:biopolymer transport protein ExbD
MHGGSLTEDEPMAEMNLIPLIDIALTLLIIMMVTTAFVRKPGVSLKLPETATHEGVPETPKDMIIVVAADGSYYVDAKKIDGPTLQVQLLTLGKRNKEARVLVKGDQDAPYKYVTNVMDMIRQAGLTKVVLPTDPKTGQPAIPVPAPATTAPASATGAGTVGAPGTSVNPGVPAGTNPKPTAGAAPPVTTAPARPQIPNRAVQ